MEEGERGLSGDAGRDRVGEWRRGDAGEWLDRKKGGGAWKLSAAAPSLDMRTASSCPRWSLLWEERWRSREEAAAACAAIKSLLEMEA